MDANCKNGRNVLHAAIEEEQSIIDVLNLLEDKPDTRALINEADEQGIKPIYLAKTLDMVETLLECGATISLEDKFCEEFLQKFVNAKNSDGRSLLRKFMNESFSIDLVKALISLGADVNAQDDFGCTPLFYTDDIRKLRFLLENGADVTIVNITGKTAADFTMDLGCMALLELAARAAKAKPRL